MNKLREEPTSQVLTFEEVDQKANQAAIGLLADLQRTGQVHRRRYMSEEERLSLTLSRTPGMSPSMDSDPEAATELLAQAFTALIISKTKVVP